MDVTTLLLIVFAVLVGGLLLPLPHGARMALFLALVVVSVLTFIGGGMHYLMSLLQ
jgi:hypothetical protein